MLQRITNSWELVKASARVLAADKELLIFPILSTVGTLAVTAVFILPMIVGGIFDSLFSDEFSVFGTVAVFPPERSTKFNGADAGLHQVSLM